MAARISTTPPAPGAGNVLPLPAGFGEAETPRILINVGLRLREMRRLRAQCSVPTLCGMIDVPETDWLGYEAGLRMPDVFALIKFVERFPPLSLDWILMGKAWAPANDDASGAELIACCAEFDAYQRYFISLFPPAAGCIEDDDERDDAIAEFHDEHAEAWERVCEQRATTPAGFKALAASIVGYDERLADESKTTCWDMRMIAVLLAGLGGVLNIG